jgi:hypothetical protein
VESVALPEVLAAVAGAGEVLVCEALLAGEFCATAETPKLAASRIAAIDPWVTVLLFTLVPCPLFLNSVGKNDTHTALVSLARTSASDWPNPHLRLRNFYVIDHIGLSASQAAIPRTRISPHLRFKWHFCPGGKKKMLGGQTRQIT